MKEKPLISIIIPVYNEEKYLTRCLDSIANQTYHNIEIIPVDDHSSDRSIEILKDYMIKDERVKPIFKERNEGTASTRMIGVNEAKGEYLAFCDADDFIKPNMFSILYNAITETKADIAQCQELHIYNDGHTYTSGLPGGVLKGIDAKSRLDVFDGKPTITPFVWNKLFSKKFIIENNIKFVNNYYEDVVFIIDMMLFLEKAVFVSDILYMYQHNISSKLDKLTITSDKFLMMINDLFFAYSRKLRHPYKNVISNYRKGTERSFKINLQRFKNILTTCDNNTLETLGRIIGRNLETLKTFLPHWYFMIDKEISDKSRILKILKITEKYVSGKDEKYLKSCYNRCILTDTIIIKGTKKIKVMLKKILKYSIRLLRPKIFFKIIKALLKLDQYADLLKEHSHRIQEHSHSIENNKEILSSNNKDISYLKSLENSVRKYFFQNDKNTQYTAKFPTTSAIIPFLLNSFQFVGWYDNYLKLYISKMGIYILTDEYYWMLSDVFFFEKYALPNTIASKPFIVVDFGMNRAYTSLYYASHENCKAVYGYEPFKHTYNIAKKNIDLNPHLKNKIYIHNYGVFNQDIEKVGYVLPDKDGASSVDHQFARSRKINNEIREENIKLVKSSKIIEDICSKNKDLLKILKIDIESSEYAVFDDLYGSSLLDRFAIITGELHLGKQDVFKYLKDSCFLVYQCEKADDGLMMFCAINKEYLEENTFHFF